MSSVRPLEPVAPDALEMVFFYPCPFCQQRTAVAAPTQPGMIQCRHCGKEFPVVPVDRRSIQYVQIMLAGGRAAADPDFL